MALSKHITFTKADMHIHTLNKACPQGYKGLSEEPIVTNSYTSLMGIHGDLLQEEASLDYTSNA